MLRQPGKERAEAATPTRPTEATQGRLIEWRLHDRSEPARGVRPPRLPSRQAQRRPAADGPLGPCHPVLALRRDGATAVGRGARGPRAAAHLRPRHAAAAHAGGRMVLVTPRFGTISPWSSKATDIAHQCGLAVVRRIERGIGVPRRGRRRRWPRRCPTLHDRMTETVLGSVDEAHASSSTSRRGRWPTVDVLGARPRPRSRRRTPPWASPSRRTRSTTSLEYFSATRPQPDRRRADDVRAGEHRALPPQDLQRVVDHRRRAAGRSRSSR